jgi:hypothetical protein
LQLVFAFARVGRSSHGDSSGGPCHHADADASFFAACCTALTMFW